MRMHHSGCLWLEALSWIGTRTSAHVGTPKGCDILGAHDQMRASPTNTGMDVLTKHNVHGPCQGMYPELNYHAQGEREEEPHVAITSASNGR